MKRLMFDFGCKPAKEGYIKITGDTLYSEETGYGITAAAECCERSTGEKPLCRDFLYLDNNSFKVKVENGMYNVRVYSGDYEGKNDTALRMLINGERRSLWVNDKSVAEGIYKVEVTNGEIEFVFLTRPMPPHGPFPHGQFPHGPFPHGPNERLNPGSPNPPMNLNNLPGPMNTNNPNGPLPPFNLPMSKNVRINAIEISPFLDEKVVNIKTSVKATPDFCSATLSWDALSCAKGYIIYRKNLKISTIDSVVKVAETNYTDNSVELCGKYEYVIAGLDDLDFQTNKSEPVSVEIVDGTPIPAPPSGLTAKFSANSVSLSWQAVEGAVCYTVYQKAPLGLYKKIATVKDTEYTDTNVKTFVDFIYAVDARTPAGITKMAEIKIAATHEKPKRKMETLDRGLVAMKTDDGVFLSWRLNAYEYDKDINFHIYRNGKRITDTPVTDSTNYFDSEGKAGDVYTVKAVKKGKIEKEGYTTKVITGGYLSIPLDKPAPYTTPDGRVYEYTANDASVADLDGDGEYEIVLKWDAGGHDNAHAGYTGIVYLDAYKLSGKKLWRINLGVNIRCGAHYTQFLVYDFDGDGKAEVICKTADGTTDSNGNVIGDKYADYRNKDGYIIEGPEYLTAFDGETGEILDTVEYDPPRGNVSEWGDSYGNRVDRFLAAVAYLDGENPSAVMCRGYYDHGRPTVLVAYDLVNKKLKKRWKFLADKDQNIEYTNQGNHNLAVGDIDGDGFDEIVYGSCAIDHDGTGIYSTGLEHGDAMHLGKFSPKAKQLDCFQIHEHSHVKYGLDLRNAGTGEIYWGVYTGRDTGRGLIANIDPRYEGCEIWASGAGLYTYDGRLITKNEPKAINFAIWWDGDLLRELLDHKWEREKRCGIGQIYKWDYEKEELKVILDTKDACSNNGTKGNPCIQADIFGDWREEVIWRNSDSTELRVYTTTHLTNHKFYTLMHDPVYRLGIAWQNTAYNQPPHTSFYIGDSMEKPPIPNNTYVRGENIPEFTEEE